MSGLASMNMGDTPEIKALAGTLASLEKAGDLNGCYALLLKLDRREAEAVALYSGHSMIFTKARREFWAFLQGEVAEACRQRCNGYELRARRDSRC